MDADEQWAVIDDLGQHAGMGRIFATREEAERYVAWLDERRAEMEQAAQDNEASGFEGGNEAWYRWNVGSGTGRRDGGEKERTYRIVHRLVTPWADEGETEHATRFDESQRLTLRRSTEPTAVPSGP